MANAEVSRRQFLATAGGAVAGASLLAGRALGEVRPRPNVVLVIVDTLRADVLGCYGFVENTSPELDALARQGVLFEHAIAPSSWTLPSIGAFLTSQHTRSLGLYDTSDYLQDTYPTLAQILHSHGYLALGITANAMIDSTAGFARGFDWYIDADADWKAEGKRTKTSDEVFREALELADGKGERPAYLQINIMETHEYDRGDGKLTRPEFCDAFEHIENRAHRRDYLHAVRQVSVDTTRFVRDLLDKPGWEDTLFVILADHGEGLDDHGHVWLSTGHGKLLYESVVRVPLIFYHRNGGLSAARVGQPVRLLDLAPTILDHVGLPVPEAIEGVSLRPCLAGSLFKRTLPEFFISEVFNSNRDKSAVYSPTWKYIENRDLQAGCNEFELQRIGVTEDGKRTDRIREHADVAARMSAFLAEWKVGHPKVQAVQVKDVTDDARQREQQLRALGYF